MVSWQEKLCFSDKSLFGRDNFWEILVSLAILYIYGWNSKLLLLLVECANKNAIKMGNENEKKNSSRKILIFRKNFTK